MAKTLVTLKHLSVYLSKKKMGGVPKSYIYEKQKKGVELMLVQPYLEI